jgi:hypothetical protein
MPVSALVIAPMWATASAAIARARPRASAVTVVCLTGHVRSLWTSIIKLKPDSHFHAISNRQRR